MEWEEIDGEFSCGICEQQETDRNELLTCQYCFASVHLKCKGLKGVAAKRMKQTSYFCSIKCTEIYKRIIDMQKNEKSILSSISNKLNATVASVVSAQMQQVKEEVKTITSAIETSQSFLSEKFDGIASDFKDLKSENEHLKLEIDSLKNSQSSLATTVNKLEMNFDKDNKKTVENNVMILGLPSLPNENVTDLVLKTFKCIGVDLTPDALVSSSRLYPNNKNNNALIPIRVIFKNTVMKETVLDRKQENGPLLTTTIDKSLNVNGNAMKVAIREELSALSLELLKEARESQKSLNIKYVWPGRGGKILVKKEDNSKIEKIGNKEDLARIMNSYKNKAVITESDSSPEQKSKRRKK